MRADVKHTLYKWVWIQCVQTSDLLRIQLAEGWQDLSGSWRNAGRTLVEVGGSYFIGKPSNYQVSLGSKTQYGIETYFKYNFKPLIQAAFDFQLINTGNRFEPIIGVRIKGGWNTLF